MFLFSPGTAPVVRVYARKDDYFPVRRIRLVAGEDYRTLSPLRIYTTQEKEAFLIKASPESRVLFMLAAFFDGKTTAPLAYATALSIEEGTPWTEETLLFSEARFSSRTIDPEDSYCWVYDDNALLFERRADEMLGSLKAAIEKAAASGSGILAGDVIAVGSYVDVKAQPEKTLTAGVNGIGSVKLKWR